MIIQHNIMALNAHRQLGGNNSLVQKNLEKLSSGYKINRAGDDAAGLAISEKMRAQITGLTRASSNAQDGISLVQTAEGALTEVHSMLNRMVDLSTQSANGTLKDDDRTKIQDEINALTEEIDRISQATNFNGINLLDGSLGGSKAGGGLVGGKIFNIKSATGTATAAPGAVITDLVGIETMNVDGTDIKVDFGKLTADEKAALVASQTATTKEEAQKGADILQKLINDSIDAVNQNTGSNTQHVSIKGTSDGTDGSYQISSGLKDNALSSITTTSTTGTNDLLVGFLGGKSAGNGAPGYAAVVTLAGDRLDLAGKFSVTLGGEAFEVNIGTAPADNAPATVLTAVNTALNTALAAYEAAKGLTAGTVNGKMAFKVNNEGRLELTNTSGLKVGFADKDGGSVAKNLGISADGKTISGGLTLQIGDTGDDFNKVTVSVDDMSAAGLGISGIKVDRQGVSDTALASIKKAINTVSTNRSAMGALQNRLEHTINNLGVTTENMTAAESRIRDVDMAKEMMHFTKNNVLAQAAQAMLAQANQQPQQVLQLLR